ncbi:DUF485 domain-containing protein [Cupriavidus alkaliphilus]|uniref:DUF485 domain-containing protein n=1 Tax=Cupriavidus alkaliphilus TaxID=942866 RepID=UPI000DC5FD75|nr:DUF485 domain-containing protein [Cupriavidus alkaliphilus]RAS09369.1 uncharacterized membrane protein (DUF485 family) [Cupriavidus alkaliphilus]
MQESISTERIRRHPRFGELVRRRARLSCGLLALVLTPYLALMLAVALQPQRLSQPLQPGTWLNLGLVLAVGIVLLGWVATWFYVRRANGLLETIAQQILSEAAQ